MHFEEAFDRSDVIGLGPSDRQVFAFAAEELDARRARPQMQFVISLTSHHPYVYVPKSWMAPYAHLDPRAGHGLQAAYLASASYADAAVRTYLSDLEERGLLEESLIVIYGDHDRGGLGARAPIPEVGPRMFGPGEDRVPLLVLIPGEEETIASLDERYVGVMGGLHDLFPTILHLLGEPTPKGVVGTHLFVENARRDPLPLPGPARLFGHRGILSIGPDAILRSPGAAANAEPLPAPERALNDQLVSQGLLDHTAALRDALADRAAEPPPKERISRLPPREDTGVREPPPGARGCSDPDSSTGAC